MLCCLPHSGFDESPASTLDFWSPLSRLDMVSASALSVKEVFPQSQTPCRHHHPDPESFHRSLGLHHGETVRGVALNALKTTALEAIGPCTSLTFFDLLEGLAGGLQDIPMGHWQAVPCQCILSLICMHPALHFAQLPDICLSPREVLLIRWQWCGGMVGMCACS